MTILELEQHIASIVANLRAKGYADVGVNLSHWGDWKPPTWYGSIRVRAERFEVDKKLCDIVDADIFVVLEAMQRTALNAEPYMSPDKLAVACAPWFDVVQAPATEPRS